MTETVSGAQLENLFEADLDFEPTDEWVEDKGSDPRPVIVFLLPGIRSDRGWAYVFTHKARSPTARTIIPEVVTGPSDLGVTDLAFRYRLNAFREDYKAQIHAAVKKHVSERGRVDVIFVCHSMGSAIFADVVHDVASSFPQGDQAKLKYIVFLGSVSRRTKNITLGQNCKRFINDVGQKDFWPVGAWLLNPWKYDPVGRFGFGRTMVLDRIFPHNNHTTSTETDHIEEWVLPIVEDEIVKVPEYRSRWTPYNLYRFVHKTVWLVAPILIVFALF